MKKLLLILLCVPLIGFGQQTYVPDDNFEQYLINQGYDNVLDDYVTTANINTVTNLNLGYQNISDLTGIEDFTYLSYLACEYNQLTSLDVTQNTALTHLECYENSLTSLDLTQNSNLIELNCGDNQLTSLNIRNGNNNNLTYFSCDDNFSLYCINVDDASFSSANWTNIDPQSYFSNNCSGTTDIEEHSTNKELLKVTDLLGRETKQTNQPLFYIYDDGTVEKRIVIE